MKTTTSHLSASDRLTSETRIPSIILPCCLLLFGIGTSCSNLQAKPDGTKVTHQDSRAKPTKHEVANSSFIGDWGNEGELSSLKIRPDGTCTLTYVDEQSGRRDLTIQGKWTQQDRVLTVHYEKAWWGSQGKTQTYYYQVYKNQGGGKEQEMLKFKRETKGMEGLAFWRDKK